MLTFYSSQGVTGFQGGREVQYADFSLVSTAGHIPARRHIGAFAPESPTGSTDWVDQTSTTDFDFLTKLFGDFRV